MSGAASEPGLSLRASSPISAPRSRVLARHASLAQTGELARRLRATRSNNPAVLFLFIYFILISLCHVP